MTTSADQIPGYRAGTWTIDHAHTEVTFSVRHMMISKVKGRFEEFDATIVTGDNPLASKVNATAEVSSINTKQAQRDEHLRSGDFFLAEEHPQISFASTAVRHENDQFYVDGDLTMRGVTKPVTFEFNFGGFGEDFDGNVKAGFEAKTVVDREDFGLTWNAPLEKGGVLLGEQVTIELDVQAQLQK